MTAVGIPSIHNDLQIVQVLSLSTRYLVGVSDYVQVARLVPKIRPESWQSSRVRYPAKWVRWTKVIEPINIAPSGFVSPRVRFAGAYVLDAGEVRVQWSLPGALAWKPPSGFNLNVEFGRFGDGEIRFPRIENGYVIGAHTVRLQIVLRPESVNPGGYGAPLLSFTQNVYPQSWSRNSVVSPDARVVNTARAVGQTGQGISAETFGNVTVTFVQYVRMRGQGSSRLGKVDIQNQHRVVHWGGWDLTPRDRVPKPIVTFPEQPVLPQPIGAPEFGSALVWAVQLIEASVGDQIEFPEPFRVGGRVVFPEGRDTARFAEPAVRNLNRDIRVFGAGAPIFPTNVRVHSTTRELLLSGVVSTSAVSNRHVLRFYRDHLLVQTVYMDGVVQTSFGFGLSVRLGDKRVDVPRGVNNDRLYGKPSVAYWEQGVSPEGWASTEFNMNESRLHKLSRAVMPGIVQKDSFYGQHLISYSGRPITFAGWIDENIPPTHVVDYFTPGPDQILWAHAVDPGVVNERAVVFNASQWVKLYTSANRPLPEQVPVKHTIDYRTKRVRIEGIDSSFDSYGKPYIAFYYQHIRLNLKSGNGIDSLIQGDVDIRFRDAIIQTRPIAPPLIRHEHVLLQERWVSPVGVEYDPNWMPRTHTIRVNQRVVEARYVESEKYGTPDIRLATQWVYLPRNDQPMTRMDRPKVFNHNQWVYQSPFNNDQPLSEWPFAWPLIVPKYPPVRPYPLSSMEMGFMHSVRLDARMIEFKGIAAPRMPFAPHVPRVEYTERTIVADAPYEGHTASPIIKNAAHGIRPDLFAVPEFSKRHDVRDKGRTLQPHMQDTHNAVPSAALVAYAIRHIEPIAPPRRTQEGIPEARYNPYPITVEGGIFEFDSSNRQVSNKVIVYEYRRIARPVQIYARDAYGTPDVRNVNRYVLPYTWRELQFDAQYDTRVRLFDTYVKPEGLKPPAMKDDAHDVSRRTRTLRPRPVSWPDFPTTHYIYWQNPWLPVTRRIDLSKYRNDGALEPLGYGIHSQLRIEGVGVWPYYLTPDSNDMSLYGRPKVTGNVIFPKTFTDILGWVGTPEFKRNQTLRPRSIDSGFKAGRPRMSPYYIYAPVGEESPPYPHEYYSETQRGITGTVVGLPYQSESQSSHPWFGEKGLRVENANRGIHGMGFGSYWTEHSTSEGARYGNTEIYNLKQSIKGIPFRSTRFGIPYIPFATQFIRLEIIGTNFGIYSTIFGNAEIPAPPKPYDPYVRVEGTSMLSIPNHTVELQNRTVHPEGIRHLGSPKPGGYNPYGTAIVGTTRYFHDLFPGADHSTVSEKHWVSNKIRYLPLEGILSSSLEDPENIEDFYKPMRVWRAFNIYGVGLPIPSIGAQARLGTPFISSFGRTITAPSIQSEDMGWIWLSYNVRQASAGHTSDVGSHFIERWSPNRVRPDSNRPQTVFGDIRLMFVLRPVGVDQSKLPSAVLSLNIGPYSIQDRTFDGPVLTDQFGCYARYFVAPNFTSSTTAQPAVRHA